MNLRRYPNMFVAPKNRVPSAVVLVPKTNKLERSSPHEQWAGEDLDSTRPRPH